MEIMKFFIRKRSNKIKKAAFGSALLMVSAFAMFTTPSKAAEKHVADKKTEITDSLFNARTVFKDIHTSSLEILPKNTRLDMLDYWDVDSVYKASNAMEGLSWIEQLTPDYLRVRVTSVSTFEIKILPDKKGRVVMTVYTVGDDVQAQDSEVRFYNEQLNQLPTERYLQLPKVKDFFEIPKGSTTKMKEIEQLIPFPTIAFNANADNDNLEARLTVEQYMDQDDWNIVKLFLKPSVILHWQKGKYK